jgi:hypothetical protein
MAAVAFDTLRFARRLIEAGVPKAPAEPQTELMAEAFVFNMDAVVTKDYLDARLDALEFRMDAKLESHFGAIHIGLKFHRRLLPLIVASAIIPFLQQLYVQTVCADLAETFPRS